MFTKFIVEPNEADKTVKLRRFRDDGSEGDYNIYSLNSLIGKYGYIAIWKNLPGTLPETIMQDIETAVELLS